MATQTILFAAASGLTIPTVRLFSGTSDTIAATASATERTNAKGIYAADYTDLAAGLYRVIALDANSTTLAVWWVRCAGGNTTAHATETPDATEWTQARAEYMDAMLQASNPNQRTVQVTSNHIAAVVHANEPNVITADALADSATAEIAAAVRVNLATELARIDAGISSRLAGASYVVPDNSSITAIKTVTDKLNTGLVQDGAFYQFTVNMLENAPAGGGGGGGDATLANQNLILNQLDDIQNKTDLISGAGGITSLLAGAVLLPGQITSFPETLVIGDSYTQTNGRAIQIPVVDTDGYPISSSGSLNFANATVTFVIKRAGETDTSRIISGTATFVDPPGTGEGFEPYALIQISSSETAKGLMKYKYTGILTFTWSSNPAEVVSFETNTITFKE